MLLLSCGHLGRRSQGGDIFDCNYFGCHWLSPVGESFISKYRALDLKKLGSIAEIIDFPSLQKIEPQPGRHEFCLLMEKFSAIFKKFIPHKVSIGPT